MIPAIRSEVRKIKTIRSTYVLIAVSVIVVILAAGIASGYKIHHISDLQNPQYLANQITGKLSAVVIWGALVGLLVFGHEYRYSTIIYSFTASNSRSKVLAAKIIVTTIFILIFTAVFSALLPLVTLAGLHLHSYHLVPQTINYGALWWRVLLFGWGTAMLALIFVALIRNQIGAIIAFILFPTAVEGILTELFSTGAKYLPFTALGSVLDMSQAPAGATLHTEVMVSFAYIIIGWFIAWVLILRRDAN